MALVYSCCFWFSLRLGGIMIGVFSSAVVMLILLALMLNRQQELRYEIGNYIDSMNLLFTKEYLESFRADPEKYLTLGMCATCLYIITCVMYIYGAHKCSNIWMGGFIVAELARLVMLSTVLVVWLLLLKQNTMDIGLLIGASVATGFILLGMFYLWVCAANLPILINEMERDEQAATIARLRQMLEINTLPRYNAMPFDTDVRHRYDAGVFTVASRYTNTLKGKPFGDSTLRYGRWN